jgi:outer membrane protein OmpA-like peptidoglycan-associated protein
MLTALTLIALQAAPGFGVRLDVGPALPVSAPQRSYFGLGFATAATLELEVLRWLDVEAQLGYALLPASAESPTGRPGTLLTVGAGARARLPLEGRALVPWLELGVHYGASGGSRLPLSAAAGLSFRPSTMGLMVGLFTRLHYVLALAQPQPGVAVTDAAMLSFGVSFEYLASQAARDRDGDGVPDARDACPDVAGADDGCSAPTPPPMPETDSDGDGISDSADRCPTGAEDKDGVEDGDGCPDEDDDGDGVPDRDDECRVDAGPGSAKGCPDQDGDGVADRDDECPAAAGLSDERGCPKYREVVVTATRIEIKQKLFFAYGKASILPKSDPLLAEVARALADRPSICAVVEGHTDNQGSRAANLALSSGRAEAVREALVARGVDAARLKAKGYGDQFPIDSNATLDGRENNRRVQFTIAPCGALEAL